MADQTETQTPESGLDLNEVAQTGRLSLAAIAHLHSRAMRDALTFNAELLDFTRRRLGANLDASERLAHCGSPSEAAGVMSSFYQGAVQDYFSESTALWRIGTGTAATPAG